MCDDYCTSDNSSLSILFKSKHSLFLSDNTIVYTQSCQALSWQQYMTLLK